jgi:hypothetical protein
MGGKDNSCHPYTKTVNQTPRGRTRYGPSVGKRPNRWRVFGQMPNF